MYSLLNRSPALWYQAGYTCHPTCLLKMLIIANNTHFWIASHISVLDINFNSSKQPTCICLLAKLNYVTGDTCFFVLILKLSEKILWPVRLHDIFLHTYLQFHLIFSYSANLFMSLYHMSFGKQCITAAMECMAQWSKRKENPLRVHGLLTSYGSPTIYVETVLSFLDKLLRKNE